MWSCDALLTVLDHRNVVRITNFWNNPIIIESRTYIFLFLLFKFTLWRSKMGGCLLPTYIYTHSFLFFPSILWIQNCMGKWMAKSGFVFCFGITNLSLLIFVLETCDRIQSSSRLWRATPCCVAHHRWTKNKRGEKYGYPIIVLSIWVWYGNLKCIVVYLTVDLLIYMHFSSALTILLVSFFELTAIATIPFYKLEIFDIF